MLTIDVKTLYRFDEGGKNYFNLRPGAWPGGDEVVLPLQASLGSDYYGPVLYTVSRDRGQTFGPIREVPEFGWTRRADGYVEAYADCVASYHRKSDTMVLLGGTTYYKPSGEVADTLGHFVPEDRNSDLKLHTVYGVLDRGGRWHGRRRLHYPNLSDDYAVWSISSQTVELDNGDLLIPAMVSEYESICEFKTVVSRCSFDGETITPLASSALFRLPIQRGVFEPSLFAFGGEYFLTMRAEDGHGYWSRSADGLLWAPMRPWSWVDGQPLGMSTNQQHWITLGGRLYLLYNRQNGENDASYRWRIPVYIAEVAVGETLALRPETEQIVFAPRGPYGKCPIIGNPHPVQLSGDEVLVGAGEETQTCYDRECGDALLARITV